MSPGRTQHPIGTPVPKHSVLSELGLLLSGDPVWYWDVEVRQNVPLFVCLENMCIYVQIIVIRGRDMNNQGTGTHNCHLGRDVKRKGNLVSCVSLKMQCPRLERFLRCQLAIGAEIQLSGRSRWQLPGEIRELLVYNGRLREV